MSLYEWGKGLFDAAASAPETAKRAEKTVERLDKTTEQTAETTARIDRILDRAPLYIAGAIVGVGLAVGAAVAIVRR